VEKQVLDSPFTKKEFLNLVKQLNDDQDLFFEDFAISDKTIVNIGNRDFVDYRPTSDISKNFLEDNSISNINLDSLHYFQIQKILQMKVYKSIRVKKSDISVNLLLPEQYDDYLQNLTKKNRHELNRKKRKFSDQVNSFELLESRENEIFKIFVSQHKQSKGEKGKFMTENVQDYFEKLLNIDGWKIYYLSTDKGVISTAFCYENKNGCYLYNSSRDIEFNSLNPGIVLNDLIIQGLINDGKSFFDFLKGTERYKFDLGGKSVQLYDLSLSL
jgi:succinate dehydrogenase flavin-adding protein (antitoxin of CptAB toxin-antitoxin module)